MTFLPPSPDSCRLAAQAMQMVQDMDKTGIRAIMLIGSTARGTATEASDLDIAMITASGFAHKLLRTDDHLLLEQLAHDDVFGMHAIGELRNIEGHYIIIAENGMGDLLGSEPVKTYAEFSLLKLLVDGVLLWEDERCIGYQQKCRELAECKLARNPYQLSDKDYQSEKQNILNPILDEWSYAEINNKVRSIEIFSYVAIGMWPYFVAPANFTAMKRSKANLPPALYELATQLGQIKLDVVNENIQDDTVKDIGKIARAIVAFADGWRKSPLMSIYSPPSNTLKIKDLAP